MPTFANGESAASVRTKINDAIDKVDGAAAITSVNIDSGTIDGVTIGGASAAAITGTTITGTSFVSSGDMTFGDNDKAIFGAGSDLQIYHDGSNSYIDDVNVGVLVLRTNQLNVQNPSGEKLAIFNQNSDVELYYDNAQKLSTTATGVNVIGTITSDGLTVDGSNARVNLGGIVGVQAANNVFAATDNAYFDGSWKYKTTAAAAAITAYRGNEVLRVRSAPSGTADTVITWQEKFKVDANGDISFYEDTGTTPKFFWDASAEALGIGTTSPAYALDVYGHNAIRSAYAQFLFNSDNTNVSGIYNAGTTGASNAVMVFETNSTEKMRIDSSGNVGIGVTPSAWGANYKALQLVYGSFGKYSSEAVFVSANAHATGDGAWKYTANGLAGLYYQAAGQHLWYNAPSGTAGHAITFTQPMTLDASGNLLVGTTTLDAWYTSTNAGTNIHSSDFIAVARSGGTSFIANRLGTDGDAIEVRKDGTTVGSIGSRATGLRIDSGNTKLAVYDDSTTNSFFPESSGDPVDLGLSTAGFQWRNLFLSGGAINFIDTAARDILWGPSSYVYITGNQGTGTLAMGTGSTEAMRIDSSRNVLIGGTTSPASATKSLALFNGTVPTGSVTDGCVLYTEDVSSSSELKVRDEAGNVTTLSPHNFDLIPEGPSEEMAWSYYSERDGKRINVDMLKAIRLLEQLTGEKLVHMA